MLCSKMLASLSQGSSRSFTRQLHSQKFGGNIAVLERYSAIRNFFRQQHVQSLRASDPFPSAKPHTSRTVFLGRQLHQIGIHPTRPFQNSSWTRAFATDVKGPKDSEQVSKNPEPPDGRPTGQQQRPGGAEPPPIPPSRDYENYSRFFRRLAMSLPHAHRPTRDELLSVATNFWQRLRIRFKWFTVRSFRKFNADDISAFVTWFVMSQTLWILIGT